MKLEREELSERSCLVCWERDCYNLIPNKIYHFLHILWFVAGVELAFDVEAVVVAAANNSLRVKHKNLNCCHWAKQNHCLPSCVVDYRYVNNFVVEMVRNRSSAWSHIPGREQSYHSYAGLDDLMLNLRWGMYDILKDNT